MKNKWVLGAAAGMFLLAVGFFFMNRPSQGEDEGWVTAKGVVEALGDHGVSCDLPRYFPKTPVEGWVVKEEALCFIGDSSVRISIYVDAAAKMDSQTRSVSEPGAMRLIGSTWFARIYGVDDRDVAEAMQRAIGGRIE